ncbi:hypothetical protein DL96DRAFT_1715340 [Flagelloscypha sp. PMI_526]|nr:hypothetical protein DL96DRAFT_1715340 [Flagelloscypha sp. PMI_526]
MAGIPPELLSQILSYHLHDIIPIQMRNHPGFVNTALIPSSLATSALRKVARPKLWSAIVLPISSDEKVGALLRILSRSSYICDWIHDVYLPSAPGGPAIDPLIRVLRSLPAVRRLHMRAPATSILRTWDFYPASLLRTLEDHIFPSLVYLQVHNLSSIPFANLLRCCPQLVVLDLTCQGGLGYAEDSSHPTFPSKRDEYRLSNLKHLVLRGRFTESLFAPTPENNTFTTFGNIGVQLTHLSLSAEYWYEDHLIVSRPLVVSHAPTLTVLSLRWSEEYLHFPRFLFDGCQFPSLKNLFLFIAWEYVNFNVLDGANMEDIALLVSLAPVLHTLRVHFKPPKRNNYESINTMHWEELDRILMEQNIFLIISSEEEEDIDGLDQPPLFTDEAIYEVLPRTLENGLLEIRDYDGAFDWCTTSTEKR